MASKRVIFIVHILSLTKNFYKCACTVGFLLLYACGLSQTPSFYHLTTSNGLYDNHVRSLAIDKQGILWIGTEEGLNMYNGHSVELYLKARHPELPSDNISFLFCDDKNRIWVGTNQGGAWVDNRRRVHRVNLPEGMQTFRVKAVIQTKRYGIIVITDKGHYYFDENGNRFLTLDHATKNFPFNRIRGIKSFGGDQGLFATDSSVSVYDYQLQKTVKEIRKTGIISISILKENKIALGMEEGSIDIIDINNGNVHKKYLLNSRPEPVASNPQPLDICQSSNGDIIIASGLDGMITIDPYGKITQFLHDPINPSSVVSNSVYRVVAGSNGEVVVGSSTSGVSMYNSELIQAGFKGFFTDAAGEYYNNYTGRMVEDADGSVWIGSYDRLIRWDPKTNTSNFYYHVTQNGAQVQKGDIRALCFDKKGSLWTSIYGKGIASFSKKSGFLPLELDSSVSPAFSASEIPDLVLDNAGLIWACTGKGIFTINPSTRKATSLDQHPVLKGLAGKNIYSTYHDSKNRIWFASIFDGVFCFDSTRQKITQYTTKDGLPSDICYLITEDKKGRYFITTSKGLAIIDSTGSIRPFTKKNGLRYERCESLLIDNENIAWFSNKNCLVRLNTDSNKIEIFDEKAGLLNDGFRVGSCLKTKAGNLVWGGYKGVSFFDPRELRMAILPLQVNINSVHAQDSAIDFVSNNEIRVPYSNNNINFGFSGIHLGIPGKTYYQYKLQGFDKEWQKAENIERVRYTTLPPGDYRFQLKASIDGIHWINAARELGLIIVPPLWMRWWFITALILLVAFFAYWIIDTRKKKLVKQKEQRKADRVVKYFASSLHEQQTVETILWDVARNCSNYLRFEHCQVYLLDESKNLLVQKASYHPQPAEKDMVKNAVEIPIGQGVVGQVALTGKPELVQDGIKERQATGLTSYDSEIAVPLIWGGKVIGVIHWQHSEKNHFIQKHIPVLVTIASLCANKIIRARAEEEKKKTETILTSTQQKMVEVEMQALRAQMNPHFIFNCLNSINRYILKSDEATASLYLTRFAKLMRLILDNSSSKNVLLSNELEALKLYIEMEALRFDKKFSYEINIDKSVSVDSIELPSLIIQPYVENAIWHGLLHKDGAGHLRITVKLQDRGMLECIIEDNGVGREKAKELKSKSATSRKSMGMQLTQNRLALLNRNAELNASISIIDMEDGQNQPTGTKVILRIPV